MSKVKHIIGNAKFLTIERTCVYCNETYVMTCEDYVLNKAGIRFVNSDGKDDYCCPDCVKLILAIKEL